MSYIEENREQFQEKVYAGVLGKIIGVYLGRPFEGWSYQKIMEELGEVTDYLNEHPKTVEATVSRYEGIDRDKIKIPLIVTDDDITGTFAFLRALEDYDGKITSKQIGQTWLNILIEKKTILWWGGRGISTEHTAYLNLKEGVEAPQSGSIEQNGTETAEQIGAQIFIDGWALVAPDNPELARDLAMEAGRVSHDGVAIDAAVLIAVMESLAFTENNTLNLIEKSLKYIPANSLITKLAKELIELKNKEKDWRKAREYLEQNYGYDRYPGACHVVPNHGLILMSLLYCEEDFHKAQTIINTSGWDTDCNAANVGCIMGIKNGLSGIPASLRDPVNDRLYLPTADGGRAISDALTVAQWVCRLSSKLNNVELKISDKKYNFEQEGSTHGFFPNASEANIQNILKDNERILQLSSLKPNSSVQLQVITFTPPEDYNMLGYELIASPLIYSGQQVQYRLSSPEGIEVKPFIKTANQKGELHTHYLGNEKISPHKITNLSYTMPETEMELITYLGVEFCNTTEKNIDSISLHSIDYFGTPKTTLFKRGKEFPSLKGWVHNLDNFHRWIGGDLLLCKDSETGIVTQGTEDWKDYAVSAEIEPALFSRTGIVAYYQGARHYLGVTVASNGKCELFEMFDTPRTLAQSQLSLGEREPVSFSLAIKGKEVTAFVNAVSLSGTIKSNRLTGGGVGCFIDSGSAKLRKLEIAPV